MCRRRLTTEEFILRAKLVHGDRYDYSLTKIKTSKYKVKILCPEHGVFEQMPLNHTINKQNCPICAYNLNIITSKERASNTIEFITKAKLVHDDKYDYSLVNYTNKKTKVKIICPEHGIFEQQPTYHLRPCGCPICNESKGEALITNQLKKHNISFIKQKTFSDCKIKNMLPFDFYLTDYNICIEYDGEQHFKSIPVFGGDVRFKKQQITDSVKNKYCFNNNMPLIRIKYTDKIIYELNCKLIEFKII